MPDRLHELQRQRGLLLEHLAWLDGEIAAEKARSGAGAAIPASAAPVTFASSPLSWPEQVADSATVRPAGATGTEGEAEAILEQYREGAQKVPQDVRTGCFIYFAVALALLVLAVAALYIYTVKRH